VNTIKNYYDVLGVRPTARPAEIDLAFKGRRTQYHPDKYGTADAETIRWATEMMQAVNEAYKVLSDAGLRARYDQSRQSGHNRADETSEARSENKTQPEDDNIPESPFILNYLTAIPLSQEDAKRFHFAPDIPPSKLGKALAARRYYATKPPHQVYLLVDDTVFGGGADGLLITDEVISFKSTFMDSSDFVYSMGWNGGFYLDGTTVKRFDAFCKSFSQITAAATQKLVWGLNQYFVDRFAWLVRMALRGDVNAQFKLSLSCHDNPEEELRWMTMAAEGGHVNAQYNLGKYYQHKDLRLAFRWFAKAAQQGSANAQRELASAVFQQFH
jgi:curved DNA-binding protein